MAIYPRSRIPKWQPPVRITRPYIKPNYLANTINSAIQAYGSVQGANLKQKMFNAKLKAAQDAKLAQQAYRQKVGSYLTNQANLLGTTSPDTYTSYGGYGMDDDDMTTVPGVNTPNPTISAIAQLWNSGMPLGQATSLAQVMHPQPDPNAYRTDLRWQQMQEDRDSRIQDKFNKRAGVNIGNVLGMDNFTDIAAALGSPGQHPEFLVQPGTSGKRPEDMSTLERFWRWGPENMPDILRQPIPGTSFAQGVAVPAANTPDTQTTNPLWAPGGGGESTYRNWLQAKIRPLVESWQRQGVSDAVIQNRLFQIWEQARGNEESPMFNYGKARSEIAALIEKHGS